MCVCVSLQDVTELGAVLFAVHFAWGLCVCACACVCVVEITFGQTWTCWNLLKLFASVS